MDHKRLKGRTVLVVERDWFLASYVAGVCQEAGARIVGPMASVPEALELLAAGAERPDAATVNVGLDEGERLPVAERLGELGVPFVFLCACGGAPPPHHRDRPRLAKPFAGFEVVQAIERLLVR